MNQRREARVAVCVPVVLYRGYRGRTVLAVETSDVSFKGLFVRTVRTSEAPVLRQLVRMRVTLAEAELEAHAMAVHVTRGANDLDAGVGLQFWGLAGPARTAWDDFVRALIHARRAAAEPVEPLEPAPALAEPNTPSGLRYVGPSSRTSTR